jgi:hypothetical protein
MVKKCHRHKGLLTTSMSSFVCLGQLRSKLTFNQALALTYFFPPIESAGFPASELAVAETFTFSFLGFLVSFLLF